MRVKTCDIILKKQGSKNVRIPFFASEAKTHPLSSYMTKYFRYKD